jgi:serine/threonine-protein kinase
MARVRGHDQWLWHVLRREAEALIFPNTAAFFEGTYEPEGNTERLALVGACRFKNRTCAAARLYADAFAADATLADDPRFRHRYSAARAAALAGGGQGEDAADLGAAERIKWRSQARDWLLADLAAWGEALDRDPDAASQSGGPTPNSRACGNLPSWKSCPPRSRRTASRFGTRWTP